MGDDTYNNIIATLNRIEDNNQKTFKNMMEMLEIIKTNLGIK